MVDLPGRETVPGLDGRILCPCPACSREPSPKPSFRAKGINSPTKKIFAFWKFSVACRLPTGRWWLATSHIEPLANAARDGECTSLPSSTPAPGRLPKTPSSGASTRISDQSGPLQPSSSQAGLRFLSRTDGPNSVATERNPGEGRRELSPLTKRQNRIVSNLPTSRSCARTPAAGGVLVSQASRGQICSNYEDLDKRD
jgi:hypothetical protein